MLKMDVVSAAGTMKIILRSSASGGGKRRCTGESLPAALDDEDVKDSYNATLHGEYGYSGQLIPLYIFSLLLNYVFTPSSIFPINLHLYRKYMIIMYTFISVFAY